MVSAQISCFVLFGYNNYNVANMSLMSPLHGLRVVELASVLAGPSVGQFFAELGAEVIKIENPHTGGDVTRSWLNPQEKPNNEGISAYFCAANFGKQSYWLDLQQEAHRRQLYTLIAKSDIVITSYKPGAAERLKVDYNTLKTYNPKLIYAHITGYGLQDQRTGYDAIIQAEAGFMYMNGTADGPPVKMPVALIDILAAHHLKEALLIALLHREKNGEGAYIHVSLFDAAIASLANQATNYLNTGYTAERMGSEHPNIVPYGTVFQTSDNKLIVLAVGNDEQFQRLCKVLHHPELAQDSAYATNKARVHNRERLLEILRKAIAQWKRDDLLEALQRMEIPAGAIRPLNEVFAQPQAQRLVIRHINSPWKGIRQYIAECSFLLPGTPCPPPSVPTSQLG